MYVSFMAGRAAPFTIIKKERGRSIFQRDDFFNVKIDDSIASNIQKRILHGSCAEIEIWQRRRSIELPGARLVGTVSRSFSSSCSSTAPPVLPIAFFASYFARISSLISEWSRLNSERKPVVRGS